MPTKSNFNNKLKQNAKILVIIPLVFTVLYSFIILLSFLIKESDDTGFGFIFATLILPFPSSLLSTYLHYKFSFTNAFFLLINFIIGFLQYLIISITFAIILPVKKNEIVN